MEDHCKWCKLATIFVFSSNTSALPTIIIRLDYCNSLFFGMSAKNFARLQRVRNTLARVILHKRKFDHITPSLMELHGYPYSKESTLKLPY